MSSCLLRACPSFIEKCREDLRKRFVKAELALFKIRYDSDDRQERQEFLQAQNFDWQPVRTSTREVKSRFDHECRLIQKKWPSTRNS